MNNKDKKLEDEQKKIFSEQLNYYMQLNHKQQDDIVKDLGINKSTISTWCRGIKMPRVNAIRLLAEYFGVNISDLIQYKEKKMLDEFNKVWKQLAPEQQEDVRKYAEYLLSKQENE